MTGARTEHRARVEWIDTDAAGIHHHAAVARYVEAAEAALMREVGLGEYFPRAPRVHYEVDYESPLQFGQGVTVALEVRSIGTSSLTLGFEIWGDEFGGRARVRAAHGMYVTVHIAGTHADGSARGVPWPAEWVEALAGPAESDA